MAPALSRAVRYSPCPGVWQLPGDRDGQRPGWDTSLHGRSMAGQGCRRAGASHSHGVSGAPGPQMG